MTADKFAVMTVALMVGLGVGTWYGRHAAAEDYRRLMHMVDMTPSCEEERAFDAKIDALTADQSDDRWLEPDR